MSDKSIAVPAQEQIEIFANDAGTVSIVCRNAFGNEDDAMIAIQPCYINAVIAALRRAAKEARKTRNENPA